MPELPSPALIEAAAKAANGGLLLVFRRDHGTWEIHNPILVDLETARGIWGGKRRLGSAIAEPNWRGGLGCCVKPVQRKARTHGIGISREVGPRINLRALVA